MIHPNVTQKFVSVLLAPFIPLATAVHPLKVQGSNFIDTVSNQRFEIIGVEYNFILMAVILHMLMLLVTSRMVLQAINHSPEQILLYALSSFAGYSDQLADFCASSYRAMARPAYVMLR